jgi:pyridoxal phosphate enzyme (YggS family)
MISFEQFSLNLSDLRERIETSCLECGRSPDEITLLPVTKNWPVEAVKYCKQAGILRVGENKVQECIGKKAQLDGVHWELIGHLQSNKTTQALSHFSRIQTLDSIKLIRKVQTVSQRIGQNTSILLQINSGNDPAKYGFKVEEAERALEEVVNSPNLTVDGLMTIAPYVPGDLSVAGEAFRKLAELRDSLCASHGLDLNELSMGMTDDLSEAIKWGSTMIRVGSALFGARSN